MSTSSTDFLLILVQQIANVQPSIIERFGDVGKLAWLGTAFALGSAATILQW